MKKILGYTIAVASVTLILSGCTSKEETIGEMQDRNVAQMSKVNKMQQSELKRLNEKILQLEKENSELNKKLLNSK